MKPIRTCIICRQRNEKSNLIRIIEMDNCLQIDIKQNANTRGSYICKDINCISRFEKHKRYISKYGKENITKITEELGGMYSE